MRNKSKKAKANILIVEDDVILAKMLERKFLQSGYGVFTAQNANEARILLKKTRIDAILLDIILPDEDGFSFLKELKSAKDFSKIPVLIVSNLGQKEEIEKGLKLGAVGYIVKADALPSDILKKISSVLKL